MVSKSKSYAFRLHPNDDREADAMAIIKQRLEGDLTLREIMCDAILHSAGRIPNLYPEPPENHLTRAHFDTVVADLKARNEELQERLDAVTEKHLTSNHFDTTLNELAMYIEEILSKQQSSRQRIEYNPTETDLHTLLEKVKSEREGKPTNIDAISRAKNKLDKLD